MTLTRKACLDVGCCSFEGYSEEASAGTGPEIKSTSVIGTQLCENGQTPGSTVDAYEEFQVQVLSVTRGVPSFNPFGGGIVGGTWTIPVEFGFRITSTCDDCDDPGTVDITHTRTFKIACGRDNTNEFTFASQAQFPTHGVICDSRVISASPSWDVGNTRTEATVQTSAISGKGCEAYDQVVFTVNLPVSGTAPFIPPIPGLCRDTSTFNFPASTSNGACVLTMEWSLLSP